MWTIWYIQLSLSLNDSILLCFPDFLPHGGETLEYSIRIIQIALSTGVCIRVYNQPSRINKQSNGFSGGAQVMRWYKISVYLGAYKNLYETPFVAFWPWLTRVSNSVCSRTPSFRQAWRNVLILAICLNGEHEVSILGIAPGLIALINRHKPTPLLKASPNVPCGSRSPMISSTQARVLTADCSSRANPKYTEDLHGGRASEPSHPITLDTAREGTVAGDSNHIERIMRCSSRTTCFLVVLLRSI